MMSFYYSDILLVIIAAATVSGDDWDDSWDVRSTSVVHLSLED